MLDPATTNTATATAFLAALYEHTTTGWLTLFSATRPGPGTHVDWYPIGDLDAAAQQATLRAQTSCVWFGVATRHRRLPTGRGGATDCHQIPGLWLDIDVAGPRHADSTHLPPTIDDAWTLLARFEHPPSIVVDSGGGLQAWWLFNEPHTLGADDPLLDRWHTTWTRLGAELGWHVDNVFDPARIMRLPGTLNRKPGVDPAAVTIAAANNAAYDVTDLAEILDDPTPPPAARATRPAYTGGDRPGDELMAERDGNDVLAAAGWTLSHVDRAGNHYWIRPRTDRATHHAAVVYADGHIANYSEASGLEVRRSYDPWGLHVALNHNGDFAAAARAWRQTHSKPRDDMAWVLDGATTATDPAEPQQVATGLDHEAFWAARPELAHIRTYAQAQMSSPWAVLGGVLANVVCQAPVTIVLPNIIQDLASINLAIALVGRSGEGKGGATSTARRAVNIGPPAFDKHTLGSGQGIAHGYGHWESGKDGDTGHVERHADSCLFIVEEVDHLGSHAAQNASTTLAELRRFLMGEKLGHLYVDRTKRVQIAEHTYRGAFLVGVQPARAGALLGDADGGTPQRFVWLPVLDPQPPDTEPDLPAPIEWRQPPSTALPPPDGLYDGRRPIPVCDTAVTAIKEERRRRARGEGDPLDGHRLLCRERVAAALGLLNGHYGITDDDWALSEHVMAISDATRTAVTHALDAARQAANRGKALDEAERDEIKEDRQDQRVARRIADILRRNDDWMNHNDLRKRLNIRDRPAFESAVTNLIVAGQIESEPIAQGSSTARRGTRYRAVAT